MIDFFHTTSEVKLYLNLIRVTQKRSHESLTFCDTHTRQDSVSSFKLVKFMQILSKYQVIYSSSLF